MRPSVEGRDHGRYWLLLEHVPGVELYQVGDLAIWRSVAGWLARFHSRFTHAVPRMEQTQPWLLRHDADYYRRWMARAVTFGAESHRSALEHLAGRYERFVERQMALPVSFIHGDFYPSNILVVPEVEPMRVSPIDWEMAAVGPGAMDLAALTAGRGWNEPQQREIVLAYHAALPAADRPPYVEFLRMVDCSRLHLAMQWLGWAPDWSPPPEHVQDWLADALQLAEDMDS